METNELINLLLLLSPIILIQIALAIFALVDLSKRESVRGPRWVWVVMLVLTSLALPSGLIVVAIYLVWGRHPEADHDSSHDTV